MFVCLRETIIELRRQTILISFHSTFRANIMNTSDEDDTPSITDSFSTSEEEEHHSPPRLNCCLLILARGNSKSIPKKNIRLFNGIPLINHVLRIGIKCNLFQSHWVSTDSAEVKQVVRQTFASSSVKIYRRSDADGDDARKSIDSVKDFLSHHPEIEVVCLVQCTSPCLHQRFLYRAMDKVFQGKDSAFSVVRDKTLKWERDSPTSDMHPVNFDPADRPRRQDMTGSFIESGHFYVARRSLIMDQGLFQSSTNGATIEIPPEMAIELDEEYQWPVAEVMYKNYFHKRLYGNKHLQ